MIILISDQTWRICLWNRHFQWLEKCYKPLLLTHRIIQNSRYIRGNSLLHRPSSWIDARDALYPPPVTAHDSLTFNQSPITRLSEISLILLGQFRNSNWKQISHTLSWKNDNALSFKFIILSAQCED